MKLIKFALSLLFTLALTFLLNTSIGGVPALGKLFSPFHGFWQNAEPKGGGMPLSIKTNGKISSESKVVWDDRMVPHIFAKNIKDAVYIQGYVTASMRLWQMEFQTHAAAGRLSEILGRGEQDMILDYDKKARREGMMISAENALKETQKDPEVYQLLVAYAEGVNDYIEQLCCRKLPIEYKLLGYSPEKWTPLKSMLLMKSMARTLADQDDDLESTNALKIFGRETFDLLFPEYFPNQTPVVPDSSWAFDAIPFSGEDSLNALPDSSIGLIKPYKGKLPSFTPNEEDSHIGSNNWAISGSKTASGRPILCNDPHLQLSLPSIWFETHIKTEEFNAYGVALPGAPGIIIGFNDNIAWGVTNVSHDVRDWYEVEWRDETMDEYKYGDGWRKSEWKVETIKIKGGKTVLDTVIHTHLGPVVYAREKGHPYQKLAFKWLPQYPSNEARTFIELNKAKNYDDYVKALSHFTSPAQNFVYSDKQGNIALWVNGKLPLRKEQEGRFIQSASLQTRDLWRFIPHEHNPHQHNPNRGFVSSCNQHSTNPTYPYYYLGSFDQSRGRRINELLPDVTKGSIQDMMRLQADNLSVKARDFLPTLLDMVRVSSAEQKVFDLMKAWDYRFDYDDEAGMYFKKWLKSIDSLAYDEILAYQVKNIPIELPLNSTTLDLLKKHPDHSFWDNRSTPEVEKAADIVTQAFRKAISEIMAWQSENTGKAPNVANFANHGIRHLLIDKKFQAFCFEGLQTGGDGSALNAVNTTERFVLNNLVRRTTGPSWRMIVEMTDKVEAYGIYPGGQSGNPGSHYYGFYVPKWDKNEYNKLTFYQSFDEAKSEAAFVQSFQ